MFCKSFLSRVFISLFIFNSLNITSNVFASENNHFNESEFKSWCGKYLLDKEINKEYNLLIKKLNTYDDLFKKTHLETNCLHVEEFYKCLSKQLYLISKFEFGSEEYNRKLKFIGKLIGSFLLRNSLSIHNNSNGCICYRLACTYYLDDQEDEQKHSTKGYF